MVNGMSDLLSALLRNKQPVSTTIDGATFYFARLSAKQKDRFDLQWASYLSGSGGSGEGFRGFVVAFCACDESGQLAHDSGNGESASAEFLKIAEQFMDSDAAKLEPCFELAAKTNGLIGNGEPEKN